MKLSTYVLFLTTALIQVIHCQYDTIKVSVYYQTSSADSIAFLTRQLFPTFIELNHLARNAHLPLKVSAKLVPYEDADDENSLATTCQGWPTRCLNNKIHACVVATLDDDWSSLNMINCLILHGNKSLIECAAFTCNDITSLPTCVNTIDGDEILIANNQLVKKYNREFKNLPIVMFDEVYVEGEQGMAKWNLLALICRKYPQNLVGLCDTARANRTMTHNNFDTGYFMAGKWICEY